MYFTSTNENDDNIENICDYLEDTSDNYSKGIYIDGSVDANTEGGNYNCGNQSHVSYQGDFSLLFKEYPMKAAGRCVK